MPKISITLDDQLAEVNRELAMRYKMYPKWISLGQMKRADANKQYAALKAVKRSLERLHEMEYGKQAKLEI
jgi:hypothetical protein